MADKQKVTFNVDPELYAAYKKALIDMKTNTTNDLIRHMKDVVEKAANKE